MSVLTPPILKSPLLISDKPGPGYGMPIVGSQNAVLAKVDPDWSGSMITILPIRALPRRPARHQAWRHLWNGTRGAMSYFGHFQRDGQPGTGCYF